MNTVTYLLTSNFSSLSIEEKCAIKALGRPTPQLDIHQQQQSRGKDYTRSFKSQIYSRNSWICGCEIENRLFCFPCILFCKGTDSAWTLTGVLDLSHLTQKIKIHEMSLSHKNACLDLSMVGRTEISQQLSEAFRLNIEKNNQNVTQNRYVLSKIIDCIRFCGEFELALRDHNEKDDSYNSGIFTGLVNFSATLDNILQSNLKVETMFKGTSKEVQNDLLESMIYVCRSNILEEINSAGFVSLIVNETSDISSKAQAVVVFRYILKTGMPVERFWTFLNPKPLDGETLFNCIKNVLEVIGDEEYKLISQSYDGTNEMSSHFTGIQARLKEDYPNAHYVHCYAHQLNLIMVQSTSNNKEARIFFANLQEVYTFFSQSSQCTSVLDEIIGKNRLPCISSTRWSNYLRSVQIVHKNIHSLIECLEKIEQTTSQASTMSKAQGLKLTLQQPEFQYWLEIFSKIMPHVELLDSSLQKKNISPVRAKQAISTFSEEIKQIREAVDSFFIADDSSEPQPKRNRTENWHTTRNAAAKEICDSIIVRVEQRFEFTGHLVAANLIDSDNISAYRKKFPTNLLNIATESFSFIDKYKLKSELQLIYNRDDFKGVKKVTHLLAFLMENNLQECFSETVSLLKALTTIPMTTAEAERCFSCLERIKTFLRNTMDEEDRLSALAMLSIEKEMSRGIPNFNEKVIDHFASRKERRMEFLFQNVPTGGTGNG